MAELLRRLSFLLQGRKRERELEEEMDFHLEIKAEASGADAACRAFGNQTALREASREAWGWGWLDALAQDLRYALRLMRRSPGFTAVAVLSLALGIGANTAIFTLLDAVLLKSLPVESPEQLVVLRKNGREANTSVPLYQHFRDQLPREVISGVIATGRSSATKVSIEGGEWEPATQEMVTGNYFSVLGVNALLGRTFSPGEETAAGGDTVAVASHRFWTRRFGRDPAVVGKTVRIGSRLVTIVGVAAPEFFGIQPGSATDLWVTTAVQGRAADHGFNWMGVVVRRQPHAGLAQTQAAVSTVYRQYLESRAATARNATDRRRILGQTMEIEPGSSGLSGLRERFSEPLQILMAVAALVLLLACVNLANLLLARAAARDREMSVRLAVGAGRRRLVRQLLTESLLLAAVGAGLGLAAAQWGGNFLVSLIPVAREPLHLNTAPDMRVLAFTAAITLLAGILFGTAPAWRSSRRDVQLRARESAGRLGPANALVAVQVALSLLLVIAATLFTRSLSNLRSTDAGFREQGVLTFSLGFTPPAPPRAKLGDIHAAALDRVAGIPGVAAVGLVWPGVFQSGSWVDAVASLERPLGADEERLTHKFRVSPRFFEAAGIAIKTGRDFTERDTQASPKVAIVNDTLARQLFGDESPVGKLLYFSQQPQAGTAAEVVGVVENIKYEGLRDPILPIAYIPIRQAEGPPGGTFVVRSALDPAALAPLLRSELKAAGTNIAPEQLRTLSSRIEDSLFRERVLATLAGFFGALALLLAAIGLYGVRSYAVARRTSEIGIRMALGARPSGMLWLILRETLALVAAGVLIGVPAALAAGRWVRTLLYGMTPGDAASITVAVALMALAAALAGYLPARRAARVDPMVALRYE